MPLPTALQAYQTLSQAYVSNNPASQVLYNNATNSLPGGNTRTSLFFPPFPPAIASASRSTLVSADGHTYIDLLGEFSAGIYGHSDPAIVSAMSSALSNGINFGAHHANEANLAQLIQERFPSMSLLRFTNSGTEANVMALSVARIYCERSFPAEARTKILVFDGAYHGAIFTFAGGRSGDATALWGEYIIAKYNDIDSVNHLLRAEENRGKVAAILVEAGMLGSGGAIPATKGFLEGLRRAANENHAVLIFDEVMTSRFYKGEGAQGSLERSFWPDLTTLGKYLGGGGSFGAFGGKREIMELLDPRRTDAIAHAGTFNNNVTSMAGGIAALTQVFTRDRAAQLHQTGENLRRKLNEIGRGTLLKVTGCGSIMCFHWSETPVECILSPSDLVDEDPTLHGILHLYMLQRGYYMARRGFIALNLALSDVQLLSFIRVVEEFVQEFRHLLEVPRISSKL